MPTPGASNRYGKLFGVYGGVIEFACDQDSNLGTADAELGVHVLCLCKEHTNLEDPECIEQLIEQVKALPGYSIHCSIECRPWSQWQHLNKAKNPPLIARIEEDKKASVALF